MPSCVCKMHKEYSAGVPSKDDTRKLKLDCAELSALLRILEQVDRALFFLACETNLMKSREAVKSELYPEAISAACVEFHAELTGVFLVKAAC